MKYVEITAVRIRVNTAWIRKLKRRATLLLLEEIPRYSTAATVSIGFHLFLAALYVGLAALHQPEVLQLREISFLDLSEDLQGRTETDVDHAPKPKKPVKQEKARPTQKSKKRKPSPKKQDAVPQHRMDMIRKQAPVSLASHSPIALTKPKTASDIIRVSPARGTRDDRKVRKASPKITLNRDSRLDVPKPTKGAVFEKKTEKEAQIVLNSRKPDHNTIASPSPAKPVLTKMPGHRGAALAPRRSKVFITGPLSTRKILEKSMPEFPRWAKRKGVGASISLQFTVMEDGIVKENVVVVRTSGSKEWDDAVIAVLKTWVFEPLPNYTNQKNQTGIITFQFVID